MRNDPDYLQGLPPVSEWDLPGMGLAGSAAEFGIPLTIFLLALLVGVIKLVLVGVTQIFVFVAAFKHPGQPLGPGISALSQVIGLFTNTFLGPIWAAGITLFYYDQRVRKEGYDIEWMMQAAGLTVPERQQNPGAVHE